MCQLYCHCPASNSPRTGTHNCEPKVCPGDQSCLEEAIGELYPGQREPGSGGGDVEEPAWGWNPRFTHAEGQARCELTRCPNFAMCQTFGKRWFFNCHDGRCLDCNMTFGRDLEVREAPADDAEAEEQQCGTCVARTCPCKARARALPAGVCYESHASHRMPQCAHWLCGSCMDRIREHRSGELQCPMCRSGMLPPAWW